MDRRVGQPARSLAGELPNSPAEALNYLLCLRMQSILPLTAIKFERLKYCLRRKAKYLPMCLAGPVSVLGFVNTGAIWALTRVPRTGPPNTNRFSCEGQ